MGCRLQTPQLEQIILGFSVDYSVNRLSIDKVHKSYSPYLSAKMESEQ